MNVWIKLFLIIAGLMGLLLIVTGMPSEQGEDRGGFERGATIKARSALRHALKDPDSMQVRDLQVHPAAAAGTGSVCGYVNARNSFGAMAGYQRFVVLGNLALIDSSRKTRSGFELAWKEGLCAG